MPEHSLKHLMNVILFLLSVLMQVEHSTALARTTGRAGRAASAPHPPTCPTLPADPNILTGCSCALPPPLAHRGSHSQPSAGSHWLQVALGDISLEDTYPMSWTPRLTPCSSRWLKSHALSSRAQVWSPFWGFRWQSSRMKIAQAQALTRDVFICSTFRLLLLVPTERTNQKGNDLSLKGNSHEPCRRQYIRAGVECPQRVSQSQLRLGIHHSTHAISCLWDPS